MPFVKTLGRFRLVKSLTWYINHLCMCVLKLFKAFSIRNASLLISTNSLTRNVFLNSQKGSFCPVLKYEKCGFKFTLHLEMWSIMNPSCLGFAFQFSVTDFKSRAEASAGADVEHRATTGQSLELEEGASRSWSAEGCWGWHSGDLRKQRCKIGTGTPVTSCRCSEGDSTAPDFCRDAKTALVGAHVPISVSWWVQGTDSCGHAVQPAATCHGRESSQMCREIPLALFLKFSHIFKPYSFRSSKNIKRKIKH